MNSPASSPRCCLQAGGALPPKRTQTLPRPDGFGCRRIVLRHGLTLIEITVVILILGILAAITTPKYSQAYRSAELEAIAEKVAEDIRQVRISAIHQGRTLSIAFDNIQGTYSSSDAAVIGELPAGFQLNANIDSQASLEFDASGTPRRNGGLITEAMITISWRTKSYFVQVGEGTGRVWVMKELPAPADGSSGGST